MALEGDRTAVEDQELTQDQILSLLNDESDDDDLKDIKIDDDDDSDKDDDKKEDDDKDKDDEDTDEDTDENDADDNDEDDLDVEDLVTPSRRKDILKDFPGLFKKHPYLEKAYYRDQKYTELFATIDDAKEILDKAETLDGVNAQFASGDIESVLNRIKTNNPEVFNTVVDNYLTALEKVDSAAHWHILGNTVKRIAISMSQESKKTDNKQLMAAAQVMNQFVFGTSEFTGPTNLAEASNEGDTKERDKLNADKEQFAKEQFEHARNGLVVKVNNQLKSTVHDLIDPKDTMPAFVKRHAIADALEGLESLISQDNGFMRVMNNAWKKAADTNFSDTSIKRIRSIYLSKAKTLIPTVVKKSRREALKGLGKSTGGKKSTTTSDIRERRSTSGRGSSSSNKRSEDGRGMSTVDFLNQD